MSFGDVTFEQKANAVAAAQAHVLQAQTRFQAALAAFNENSINLAKSLEIPGSQKAQLYQSQIQPLAAELQAANADLGLAIAQLNNANTLQVGGSTPAAPGGDNNLLVGGIIVAAIVAIVVFKKKRAVSNRRRSYR